uniref:Uncharacterized protein n=1 Tax=Anguilla anguilla TaxID=7936 RepID=A0A0E9XAC1_ANGAN
MVNTKAIFTGPPFTIYLQITCIFSNNIFIYRNSKIHQNSGKLIRIRG